MPRIKPYENEDGYRVWLSRDEFERLLETASTPHLTEKRVAFRLGAEAGHRRNEAATRSLSHLVGERGNYRIRIWEEEEKKGHYREPPISDDLATQIQTLADLKNLGPDEPVLQVTPKTLYRWVRACGENIAEETEDDAWKYLDFHDLRRSWGTHLVEVGVIPSIIMDWGGWSDFEHFRKYYIGAASPEAIKRERAKIPYLDGGDVDLSNPEVHMLPISNQAAQRFSGES